MVVNANLPEVFTATDGMLDSGQANIVFTTLVSGVTTPTYVWTFSGFQTAPTRGQLLEGKHHNLGISKS